MRDQKHCFKQEELKFEAKCLKPELLIRNFRDPRSAEASSFERADACG